MKPFIAIYVTNQTQPNVSHVILHFILIHQLNHVSHVNQTFKHVLHVQAQVFVHHVNLDIF